MYDLLTAHGAQIGSSYEEFMSLMQQPKQQQQARPAARQNPGHTAQSMPWGEGLGALSKEEGNKKVVENAVDKWIFSRMVSQAKPKPQPKPQPQRSYVSQLTPTMNTIYDILKDAGEKVGSVQQFQSYFERGYGHRKAIYDKLVKLGAFDGSYNEFAEVVGLKPKNALTNKMSFKRNANNYQINKEVREEATLNAVKDNDYISAGNAMLDSTPTQADEIDSDELQNSVYNTLNDALLSEQRTDLRQKGVGFTNSNIDNGRAQLKQDGFDPVINSQIKYMGKVYDRLNNKYLPVYQTTDGKQYHEALTADKAQRYIDVTSMPYRETELRRRKQELEDAINKRGSEIDRATPTGYALGGVAAMGLGSAATPNNAGFSRLKDTDYLTLQANLKEVDEALGEIEEAKKGLASDKWIANSNGDFERFGKRLFGYFGGSYRGFMHSIGKVSTWDFGLSDMEAAMGVARAVRKADKVGFENLSKEQQKLLNDAAQHMMISQEYAHLIGRGYKAGQVTAESLPFMLEMIVNPASSMGKAAQQKVVRSLIKKFGKDAIRKSAQKYLLKKYGARVVGDALGASVMASTTGSGRVYADTRRRMTGDLNYNVNESGEAYYDGHEKGESFVKAFAKAFGAQAIENHSEMLGEYIKPLLGVVGKTAYKGLTKATAKNLYTRFGVNKVRGMINDVMSTPFAKFVSDLESRAKWNGMLGEYAEEVIGNVENALLVGDNTLDADENTGVFDLDQNIDTFLGVSLMGGFVSSVKTGYYLLRGKKRLTLNEMNKAGRAIDSAFSGNIQLMNTWGGWRNTILLGTDEEKKSVLREILDNKSIPMNVRMRILDYAKSAQEYQGIVKAQQIRRYSSDEASVLSERIDNSADEGYEATNEQKNAIRRAYRRAKKKFDSVFGEQAKELLALDENELFMLTDEMTTKKANAIYDYLDSKSRYEGMLYAVQDKVNDAVDDSNKSIDERTHTDGTLIKATMNVDDRQVYIVNGNIVLRDDGSIDMDNSDKSIVIVDAETNKREMVAPSAFKSVDTPVSAEEVKAKAAQEVTEQITREESDIIDGKLDFNVGDTYDVVDQNENQFSVQIIEDKGDNVVVQINGQQTEMAKADVQKMYDDYVQLQDEAEDNKDGNAEAQEESQSANELKEGSYVSINGVEYTIAEISDNNVTLVDSNGKRIPWSKSALDAKLKSGDAEVLKPTADVKVGDVYMDNDGDSFTITRIEDNNVYVADSNGVEYEEPYEISVITDMINAGMLTRKENEHASEAEDNASSEDEDNASSEGMSPASDEEQNNESDTPTSPTTDATPDTSEPQNEPMPMKTVGKGKNARQQEDWLSTTPKRGYDYLFNEVGLKREEAKGVLDAYLAEAQKKLDAERKKEVKFIANVQAYKKKKIAHEKRITELQAEVDYWKSVKDEYMKVLLEEKRERDAKDAADHDQAVEDELKRKEDEARKKAETEARGSNAVSAEIRDKWKEANKIVGAEDEVTLPNGETITGHYILVESGAATPSHQSTNGFEETEGFPVDQDGKNVNDRDYKRDKEAQQITLRMGENYDQRAIQSPIVVSQDGVVLSGNGRTMAGEIAAQNGTDIKYNDYLRKYGNKYGFTQEQIAAYQHPRVVFVPDVAMPYNSETFAKFNQREQKSQNRTETAVKMGKLVSDDLFGRVMSKVNEFSTLGEFYANDKATTEVIKELAAAGVIPQTEMAGLFDGGKLSEVGQGIVEGVMIGKAFQANPDAVRQITEIKSMRQAVMTALQDVAINNRLGNGYDLSNELAAAIDLVYKARKAGFQLGQHVSQYAHQGNLFQLDDGATVADFNNAAVMMLADVLNDKRVTILKQVISSYNAQAENSSQGIGDLLSGGAIRSKEEIINEINQLYNNGQEYNRTAETASDRQGRGSQGSEQGTVDSESNSAGKTRELANEFNALATELKTAEGEERMRVLGEMRDCIAHFAEENGYPVPEFLLTREDFLAAVPEKDRAKVEQWLDDGWHCPAYYEKGKVYYFVEGCDNFDKDVSETLSHEYTHADNAEYPENVNALTYAVEDTHEVSQDELIDILETLSNSSHYEEKAERLESEGKNSNPMLADEVIAHAVSLMVVNGEQTLDGITKNPTLQFIIKRAYKVRENERRHNILASETSERSSNTSKSSEANSGNSQSVAEGESKLGRYGRSTRSETNSGRTEETEVGKLSVNDGRGDKGRIGERQGNQEKTEESSELDDNGIPFVKSSNGTTIFGEIRDDSGLTPAPIKLSEGFQDENGKGYGLAHIEVGHGIQIRNAGFKSVEDFVSFIAQNYDEDNIRVGKRRVNGNTTYLIQVSDEHDNTLFIEMSRDNSYWNVNSAGIFRKGYSNKKETVAKTEPQQPNNAISSDSSLSDGKHNGIMPSEPNGESTVSSDSKVINNQLDSQGNAEKSVGGEEGTPLSSKIEAASAKVNTEPTEAQKEAGNYKKGHVQVGTFDITIEQPQGSVRKGTDADGKQWESKMNNTYGYIRGAVGVDGDHIDVFLSNDIDGWNGRKVFVVDQYNPDGSFDEHKVMLGFNDADEAKSDYLANYENGWEDGRRIDVSAVNLEDFEKWIASSKRKTKPFGEYSLVKKTDNQGNPLNADGTLKLEKVKSVDDLTDEDFSKPTRSVELPHVPENVDNALGADGKPVIIKKNIFEKNWEAHKFPFAESRSILKSALYNTDLIGQTQPTKRPLHWVAIKLDEKSPIVVLEVNENKDNVEIVGWYTLDGRNLERIKRQAEKNGGELVMLSPKDKVESLSTPQHDLSSDGKGKKKVSSEQGYVRRKNVNGENESVRQQKADIVGAESMAASKPSKSELVLRDAVIDHLRENGMDVITDEAEGQSVLDMANGADTRFEAARHKSKEAEERDKQLRTQDLAIAIVTGKTEQQVRAERRERERRFKEETKELYERVLSGNFDDVTLRLIDNYINQVTPYNYYGRPLSKRLPPRVGQKVSRGEQTGSIDAFFSRISESAVGANERTRPEARRRIEEKKKELLKAWAIATGNWHTSVNDFTNANEPLGRGKDSDVYVSKDGDYVIKVSKGKDNLKRFRPDMDNVALFNYVFPNSSYDIVGYGEIDGKFVRFLRQPIVDFTDSIPLSVEERVAYMEHLGFKPINDEKTAFSNGQIVAADIQKNNIVKDKQGNIRVIDADMRLHTKDMGGDYAYPPVERDTELNANIREHRVYHGSGADFDAFDHSHMGEGEGSQSFGWGTYVTNSETIGKSYAKRSMTGSGLKRAELESNISRAKEQLPFVRGEVKEELEAKIRDWETQLENLDESHHLYTVEIPEDNGKNYLDWNAKVGVRLLNKVNKHLEQQGKRPINPELDKRYKFLDGNDLYRALSIRMPNDDATFNDDKAASEFLSSLGFVGIKYPAGSIHGGVKEGDTNYVIFNEKDAQITDHVRFFRTANGEAYGFTVGGKIYIDPKVATSETPVHEYAHLWATALKTCNPNEWQNVVSLMKGTSVWNEVKKLYPELKSDDEIADEVLATYSGRRGAERLREEMKKAAAEKGNIYDKAAAVNTLQRVKQAIDKFWKAVADFLHIHYESAEQVADQVMKDLLNGVDPRSMMDGGKTLRPDTRINVVEGNTEHGFKNYAEAKDWAKEQIARTYSSEETGGKGDIRISNAAINKYLSQSAVDKSDSKDVHLSVLKVLPDVIRESVDAEQHADYKKGEDGVRSAKNGINPNVTIHRLYGAVRMGGRLYRVKVTLKEDIKSERSAKKAYSYEATKIELLAGTLGKPEGDAPNTNNSITAAKLLNGVEKSNGDGKFFEDYNKVREQFIGEQGAERADHAEEVSTRLDNLSVAREMEAEKKDAKAIKMATGWERGADGKWRYEIADMKEFDRNGNLLYRKHHPDYARYIELQDKDLNNLFEDGEELTDKEREEYEVLSKKYESDKFGGEKLDNNHTLEAYVDAPELFKAYPELKDVGFRFEDTGGNEIASYRYISSVFEADKDDVGEIVVNTGKVSKNTRTREVKSAVLHEIQHAIQEIEGFAGGGSPETIRQRIEDYVGKNEEDAENTKSIIKSAFDLFGKASKLEIIYPIMINSDIEWQRQTATDAYWDALNTIDNGFRHFETEVKNDYSQFKGMSPYEIARTGYHVKETIKELKRMSDEYLKSLTDDDRYLEELVDRYKKALESDSDAVLYTKLSGEVESRNVERRMGMSAEERRASLAAETEDVSREDQIFLTSGDGVDPRKFMGNNEKGFRFSAKQKRALETATIADESTNNATVVSSADGAKGTATIADDSTNKATGIPNVHAKVQTNLENLARVYAEKSTNKTRGFITDLSRALNLAQHEASNYGTFALPNGKTLAIRISNHNARVSNFDKNNENNGISIVISSHRNKRLNNDGKAHIVEYFYHRRAIENATGKPLAEILESIKDAINSGKFKDTTGLAERQEVNDDDVIRFQLIGEKGDAEGFTAFANQYGVDAEVVKDYASGMKTGNLQKAEIALAEIRRTMRVANRGMKLSEFGKLFRPVQKELTERYGDIEKLRQEYIDAVMRERGVMEAARKRAEEEEAKRKARADELSLLSTEELDKRYFDAIENGDDATAREMLDEAARRKGYDDTESDYQGVGAWSAPENPGYESDKARRDDLENSGSTVNLEDIALGYTPQPDDYFYHPEYYSMNTPHGLESVKVINAAIDAIKNGEEGVKVKVYRAVPTSVKEGKLRNGDWVTPSKKYAEMHGNGRLEGKYRIIEDEVPANELWWDGNDGNEWGFDDGRGYKYKNVENNRKLNDLVTRDDNGEIIPPSKRFDENVEDVRYRESEPKTLKGEEALAALENIFNEPTSESLPSPLSTLENFREVFSLHIRTFLGELVKVKDEVFNKIIRERRANISGAILSTIENADFAIRDTDGSTLYVKRYKSDNSGNTYNVVAVNKHGEVEDYVSSVHIKRDGNLRNKIKNGAELLLPQERNTDGILSRNNSTPAAKVVKDFGISQLSPSEKSKHQVATDLARQMHIEGVVDVLESSEGLSGRKARAKGWFDPVTGRITIVLSKNENAADVARTIFHEAAAHLGLRELVGKEHYDTFLDNIYNNAEKRIQDEIKKKADEKYKGDLRRATDEYMAELAEDGEFVKQEHKSFLQQIKDSLISMLRKVGIKLGFELNDNDLRYILWRSWKNLAEGNARNIYQMAEDARMQDRLLQTPESQKRHEQDILLREANESIKNIVEDTKKKLEQLNEDKKSKRKDAVELIGGQLSKLHEAMRVQREYDMHTVASITELAQAMLKIGMLKDLSNNEANRILSVVKNVHGKRDISQYVQNVFDIMIDNQLKNSNAQLTQLLMFKGKKKDARGVEVQGKLDVEGQRIADVVWHGLGMSDEALNNLMSDLTERMNSSSDVIARNAKIDYAACELLKQYNETIRDSKSEEKELRASLAAAKEDLDAGNMEHKAYLQYRDEVHASIRENKMERIEAYQAIVNRLGGMYGESMERAKQWREAEIERVKEIHHNANSDMEGRPCYQHYKPTAVSKAANSSFLYALTAPLGTFEEMLRMFGNKNVRGEGYLWNRYMRGFVDARNNEVEGYWGAMQELDDKVAEVFGKGKKWSDLFSIERKLPKGEVRIKDGNEVIIHELPQGNLLYIYMVNKMSDGRMKLRKMDITEATIEDIESMVDPKLKKIADWLQDEFLVKRREKYNKVHERMFGASMAAIDNYFPLKILKNAIAQNTEIENKGNDNDRASTITGSIKKRTRNSLALDIMNADAFSVVIDHIKEMEHWAAFAEWNRDLNTLLSYKRFRNQVINMSSVYGAGNELLSHFEKVCQIAAGVYKPSDKKFDKVALNIAKGVTGAKVTGRVFTAFKQLTSYPAYLSDANPLYLANNLLNPAATYEAWKWSMENLPMLRERFQGRFAGDPLLMSNKDDWSMWRSKVAEFATKYGMAPNAFVDALTISMGTHAVYKTKLAKYLRMGYSEEQADKRAKQDATISYNMTQQSSEGAFMSMIQSDRTWITAVVTAFRNSSISYTRMTYNALRNTLRRFKPGYRGMSEEFMAKQMEREGIDPNKASEYAKREYRLSVIRDFVTVGVFAYILPFVWNLTAYTPYLLFGDDDDKKKDMWSDIFTHTMFGSVEGLALGDMYSATLNSLYRSMFHGEDFNANNFTKDLPFVSDINTMVKDFQTKEWGVGLTDVINIMIQSGIGINPQTLTDAVVAIYDYCGADEKTPIECALLIMRIMNCPQSQMDKIYFDELDMTGAEAKQLKPAEIAKRYAEYKAMREAPIRILIPDDGSAKARNFSNAEKRAKEDVNAKLQTEETKQLLNEYKETAKKLDEIGKLKDEDEDAYIKQMQNIKKSDEYKRYKIVGKFKAKSNKFIKIMLNSENPEERKAAFKQLQEFRDSLIKSVNEIQ